MLNKKTTKLLEFLGKKKKKGSFHNNNNKINAEIPKNITWSLKLVQRY